MRRFQGHSGRGPLATPTPWEMLDPSACTVKGRQTRATRVHGGLVYLGPARRSNMAAE